MRVIGAIHDTKAGSNVAACLGVMDSAYDPHNNLFAIGAMTASCLGDEIGAGSVAKQAEELVTKLAKIF